MTQVMKASEVRQNWGSLLNKEFKEQTRVVVEKSGIPGTAVISAEDLVRFNRLEEQRAQSFQVLDRIGEAFKEIPSDELNKEVAKALAEARAENRAKAVSVKK